VIRITKFDGSSVMLNPEQIQTIEATPDTVITLTTGTQILVRDKVDDLVSAFCDYKKRIHSSRGEAQKSS